MKKMKIVIDIDEDYVKIINKNGASNYTEEVIKNGTILPKEHGRLKDIDKIEDLLDLKNPDNMIAENIKKIIDAVPTIIEADVQKDQL